MTLENFRAVNLKIDRANGSFLSDQFAKAGDYNGRRLVVQLSNAGVVGDLTGVDVNLGWQHDTLKNTGLYPFEPVDLTQGIFEIYYPKEMLTNGNVTALIQIIENDHITETKNFKIKVEKSVIDEDTIVSENSFTVLQDALLTVNRYDSRITNVENSKVDKSTFEQSTNNLTAQLQQTEQELSSQLAQTDNDLYLRGINVLNPPLPLEPMQANGTDETDKLNAIFQYCVDNNKAMVIPETQNPYLVNKFNCRQGVDVIGVGRPQIDITFIDGTTVKPTLGFASHTTVKNIYFNNTVADIEWNRGELAHRSHIQLINCKIEGMQHGTNMYDSNAWGLYLDNTHDIDIINCEFENNTQSDIAIVENCYNINIVKPTGSNLHINLEPNTGEAIYNVTINGGVIKRLSLLENRYTTTTIRNMTVQNARIEQLNYRGSAVDFIGCEILDFQSSTSGTLWGGEVEFNGSIRYSEPLLPDPYLTDIGNDETSGLWHPYYTPLSGSIQRQGDFLVFNVNQVNTTARLGTQKITVKPQTDYVIEIESYAKYLSGSSFISIQAQVYYYDSLNNTIDTREISINKGGPGETTPLSIEKVLLKTPENTASLAIRLANVMPDISTAQLLVKSIQLYEVSFGFRTNQPRQTINKRFKSSKPTTVNVVGSGGVLFEKGTLIYNSNPQTGGFIGWVCLSEGNPGTWKGFGLIEE